MAITGVSTTPSWSPTTARPSRTPPWPIPTTPGSSSSDKSRQKDGSWSEWEKVDSEENLKILDNLPEEDEELTPDAVRPDNLNDPLPVPQGGSVGEGPHRQPRPQGEEGGRPGARQPWAAWAAMARWAVAMAP